jgi:hypothetical protein
MTRKLTRNYSLGVVAPFIAILTLLIAVVVLAQTSGAGQTAGKANAVLAPAGAFAPAQAERPLTPWTDGAGRSPVSRSHTKRQGARPMDGYPPSFLPVVTYDSGGEVANSVAVGDLNGDGHPDLVVTNQCQSGGSCNTGTASVLLGNGDGTFQAPVSYGTGGYHPWWVAIADVNRDGKPDFVVTNFFPGTVGVGVFLGNGDGTFQAPVSYGAGMASFSVAIGDLRGIGIPDLAVADWCNSPCNSNNGVIEVLLGNGDGTFQAAVGYGSGGLYAYKVAIGELNGDGHPDLVVTNNLSNSVSVLLGNGDGTFQAPVSYNVGGSGAGTVVIGDVNGDGYLDLVVGVGIDSQCGNCSDGGVSVLLGNGDGTFQPATVYDSGGYNGFSVAIGDVNGDGYPDVVVGNTNSNSVGVLMGNDDGTFQPAAIYSSGGNSPYSIALADLNGDGKLDVIMTNMSGGSNEGVVGVMLNNTQYTPNPSATTLTSSPNPSTFGQVVTFTASVSAEAGTPTGTVEFFDGDVVLGSARLMNGNALFPASWLTAGSHSVVAMYQGDGRYLSSASAPTKQVVNSAATTTSLVSSLNPSVFGQAVTFTAQVSSTTVTPTGTVEFLDGSTALGSATLANGSASLSISSLTAGTHSVTAAYQGTGNFDPSQSAPLNEVVNTATTTTSLVSSVNPVSVHHKVTYTATVVGQYGGLVTGTVTFQDGGTAVATVSVANSQAAYSTTYSKGGAHAITAVYSGDGNNVSSTSGVLMEYVAIYASKTVVTTSGSPSHVGQPVTFTATVTSEHGAVPDGELVTFYDGKTEIGTGATASGVATFTTSSLSAKTHTIKATYAGDDRFEPSAGSVKQVVDKIPTMTALSSSPNPSAHRQAVTFTATVTSAGPAPTGKVKFMDGTKSLGSRTLSSGVATLTNSTLAVGTHPITAQYLGDAANASSTSSELDQVVQ